MDSIALCIACPYADCIDTLENPCQLLIDDVKSNRIQERYEPIIETLSLVETQLPLTPGDMHRLTGLTRNKIYSMIRAGVMDIHEVDGNGRGHKKGNTSMIVIKIHLDKIVKQ